MRLTLDRIEFGKALKGSVAALPAKRNACSKPSTSWDRTTGRNGLVYPFLRWLAKPGTLTLVVTLSARLPQRTRVWLKTALAADSGNVLGTIAPTPVDLDAGESHVTILVDLESVALGAAGIGTEVVHWSWLYGPNENDISTLFAETEHDVYAILQAPSDPWRAPTGEPGDAVWTDLLDWTCRWAARAMSAPAAAAMITESVFQLGGPRLEYDGTSSYTGFSGDRFMCGDFLRMVDGSQPMPPGVNCTDMSAIIVTAANSLGCRLDRYRLLPVGMSMFDLNEFLVIGLDRDETIIALPEQAFGYHEFGMRLESSQPSAVYDACVALDFDDKPSKTPSDWQVSAGLDFRGSKTAYVERLVRAAHLKKLARTQMQMLPIETRPAGFVPAPDKLRSARYKRYVAILRLRPGAPPVRDWSRAPLDDFTWSDAPVRVRTVQTRFSGDVEEQLWRVTPRDSPGTSIIASVYGCASEDDAFKVAAEALAWTDLQLEPTPEGRVTYLANKAGTTSGFSLGKWAIRLRVPVTARFDVRRLTRALIRAKPAT